MTGLTLLPIGRAQVYLHFSFFHMTKYINANINPQTRLLNIMANVCSHSLPVLRNNTLAGKSITFIAQDQNISFGVEGERKIINPLYIAIIERQK